MVDIRRILRLLVTECCRTWDERYLALGRGSPDTFLGFASLDIYSFCRGGGAIAGKYKYRLGPVKVLTVLVLNVFSGYMYIRKLRNAASIDNLLLADVVE